MLEKCGCVNHIQKNVLNCDRFRQSERTICLKKRGVSIVRTFLFVQKHKAKIVVS